MIYLSTASLSLVKLQISPARLYRPPRAYALHSVSSHLLVAGFTAQVGLPIVSIPYARYRDSMLYGALYISLSPCFAIGFFPIASMKSVRRIYGMSYLLNLSITLFNQELDPDAILRVVMPRGIAEHKPLFNIGCQGYFIR